MICAWGNNGFTNIDDVDVDNDDDSDSDEDKLQVYLAFPTLL